MVIEVTGAEIEIAQFALAVTNNDATEAIGFIMGNGGATMRHPFVPVLQSTQNDDEQALAAKICYICRLEQRLHSESVEEFLSKHKLLSQGASQQQSLQEIQVRLMAKEPEVIVEEHDYCPVCYEAPLDGSDRTFKFSCGH